MTQASDEQTLKEIRAKLIGHRVDITYTPATTEQHATFVITPDNNIMRRWYVVLKRYKTIDRAWLEALRVAREFGGEIFGPPGYDTTL